MTVSSTTSSQKDRPIRSFASHTPKWQRFQNKTAPTPNNSKKSDAEKEIVPYQRQYSHVYSYRLAALKEGCWKNLPYDENCKRVNRILELKENELSSVVGTIVVESLNGNSDANYYNNDGDDEEDRQLHPDVVCRSCDQLFLEDESGRVALKFAESSTNEEQRFAYQYCTGVVAGVQGSVDDRGIMHVQKIVSPALPPPKTGDNNNDDNDDEPHLLLVSSLNCGDPGVSSLPRELLVSYLQGHFGDASKVARIVVAGSGPGAVDPAMGLREFDLFGLEVTRTAGIPLDILPSDKDPTTRNWPQRPLHSSLLPHTLKGSTNSNTSSSSSSDGKPMTRTTPNPYQAEIGGQLVLGTDGLNVRDLQKHILKKAASGDAPVKLTELEALEQTLKWAHLCPTGPNSIGMVPSGDPMAMTKQAANVYFCGNSNEGFATKLYEHGDSESSKTRLVCLPKFSETGEAVLVNLKTLQVEVLRFAAETEKKED